MVKLKNFNRRASKLIQEPASVEYLKSIGFLENAEQVLAWLKELEELRKITAKPVIRKKKKNKKQNRRIK